MWRVFVGCQVTTQQRSGPDSAVSRFLKSESPALSLRKCRQVQSVGKVIEIECANAGLRRAATIAKNLQEIYSRLEGGEWPVLIEQLQRLEQRTSPQKERDVISYLLSFDPTGVGRRKSRKYPGLGQKQSRNFIQWLGLSKYEIPIDSRILKKMKEFGSNFVPSGSSLTDEVVYLFVQGALQRIAKSIGIYPCELDACIFASFDIEDDTEAADEEN